MFLSAIFAELISSVTDSNNLAGFARPLLFQVHHAKVLKKCDLRQSVFWSVNVLGTGGWGTSDVTSHVHLPNNLLQLVTEAIIIVMAVSVESGNLKKL